jgi:hypothetical protein
MPSRRSFALIVAILFVFLVTYARNYYQSELVALKESLIPLQEAIEERRVKFAMVTYETRHVTYWRESLGNKLDYSRRHGYRNF